MRLKMNSTNKTVIIVFCFIMAYIFFPHYSFTQFSFIVGLGGGLLLFSSYLSFNVFNWQPKTRFLQLLTLVLFVFSYHTLVTYVIPLMNLYENKNVIGNMGTGSIIDEFGSSVNKKIEGNYTTDPVESAGHKLNKSFENESESPPELLEDVKKTKEFLLFKAIGDTSKEGRWDDFISEIETLSYEHNAAYDYGLGVAVQSKAPYQVVIELVDKGAVFSPFVLATLAGQNRLSDIEKYENIGLNVAGNNSQIACPYLFTFYHPDGALDVFNYLIERNVNVGRHDNNRDAVTVAIAQLDNNKHALYKLKAMLALDPSLIKNHQTSFNLLKSKRPKLYSELELK